MKIRQLLESNDVHENEIRQKITKNILNFQNILIDMDWDLYKVKYPTKLIDTHTGEIYSAEFMIQVPEYDFEFLGKASSLVIQWTIPICGTHYCEINELHQYVIERDLRKYLKRFLDDMVSDYVGFLEDDSKDEPGWLHSYHIATDNFPKLQKYIIERAHKEKIKFNYGNICN